MTTLALELHNGQTCLVLQDGERSVVLASFLGLEEASLFVEHFDRAMLMARAMHELGI